MRTFGRLWLVTMAAILLAACNSSGGGGGGGNEEENGNGGGNDNGGNGGDGGDALSAFEPAQFLIGNDGSSGNTTEGSQLWVTDGTEGNTALVKDIFPGDDARMAEFTRVEELVFFRADDGSGNGEQLWVTDGTEDGTLRLTGIDDLDPGTATMLTELDGALYFRGRGAGTDRPWIWTSDGTPEGTELVSDGAPPENGLTLLTAFNGHLYFAHGNGGIGMELWRSDGTPENTSLFANIQAEAGLGSLYSCPDRLVEMDGMLYFAANDAANECALWRTSGEDGHAEKVRTISAATNTGPAELTTANGSLYFLAGGGATPASLWVSDGTEEGTSMVLESDDDYQIMLGGVTVGMKYPLMAAGDHAYFHVYDRSKASNEALQLWYTDGTDVGLVVDLERNVLGDGVDMAVAGDLLYYVDTRPDKDSDLITPNRGLWKASGGDVELVHSGFTASNGGEPLIPVADGETLLFSSMGEVWRTDGSSSGTEFVKDICPGPCFGFFGPTQE